MSSSARRKSGWWQTRRRTPIRKRSSPIRAVSRSLRSSRPQRARPPPWISLLRVQTWGPDLGSRLGVQTWCPDLGSRLGVQTWGPGANRLISGLLASNLIAGLRDYLVAGEWRPGHDEVASEDNPLSGGGSGVLGVPQRRFGGRATAWLL